MSLVKKLKDILFEEEEELTEPIKVREEIKKDEPKIVKIEPKKEERREAVSETPKAVTSERELFRSENTFQFPDFDEEEFKSNMAKPVTNNQEIKSRANVLEYERKKTIEKRTDYGRYERVETREYSERKKFKPSPIISPVYGILNQDYKADDIVKKNDNDISIDIETVRRKAFEPKKQEELSRPSIKTETVSAVSSLDDDASEPVVTFFEEKDKIKLKGNNDENFKSIDDLLESAADEINLEDTLEIPKTNNLDAIEEELEKLDVTPKEEHDDLDDTLDNDLFELIDSMYDEREEGE